MFDESHISVNYFDIKRFPKGEDALSFINLDNGPLERGQYSARKGVSRQETKNNSAVVAPMSHNGYDYGYNKFP